MLRYRFLAASAAIIAIALPVVLWIMIASTSVNIPFWDEWEWADLIYKFHLGTLTFVDLWAAHNEHRMLFPQLIMLGLDRFGGWSPVREQFVSLFFVVCTQIGIFTLIRRSIHGSAALVAFALASILLYGLWQAENFTWGFQMAWFICNAGAVGVAALLGRVHRGTGRIAAAVVLATFASFSSSQGLVTWLVGAVAIVTMQRNAGRLLAVWLVCAVAAFAAYQYHLRPQAVEHTNILLHPRAAGSYILTYLGSPIARSYGAVWSLMMGALGVGVIAISVVADLCKPNRRRHLLVRGGWYALAAYALGCAVATSVGRATFGPDQALASRYTTISGLLWIAIIGLCATWYVGDGRRYFRRSLAPVIAATVAATLLTQAIAHSESAGWQQWVSTEARLSSAFTGLEHSDPAALTTLYPSGTRVEMLLEEMRKIRDGPLRNG